MTLSGYKMFTLPDTDADADTDKIGYKVLCGSVHTARHRKRHRHRWNWVANPFCQCRIGVGIVVGVGQCEHTITGKVGDPS